MGSGGGTGAFIKGLKLGVIIKVGLVFLPFIMSKLKARQSGMAYSYVSDTRGSKQDITDPLVIARNIQRVQYKKLNENKPASLTRFERGTRSGGTGHFGQLPGLVDPNEFNIGLTGFPAYTHAMNQYNNIMGGRRR